MAKPTLVSTLARKMRRATRNGTGFSFTPEEWQLLAEYGVMEMIARMEIEELMPNVRPLPQQAGWSPKAFARAAQPSTPCKPPEQG